MPTRLLHCRRVTYTHVSDVLAATARDVSDNESADLLALHGIAERRRALRVAHGALTVSLPAPHVSVKLNGTIEVSRQQAPSRAHILVEECMVLAGEVCASMALKHDVAMPFRTQLPPPNETAALFASRMRAAVATDSYATISRLVALLPRV
jgi:exoribonuclease-2